MRVLVCGGRDYFDEKTMRTVLDKYFYGREDVLICGMAKGADLMSRRLVREIAPDAHVEEYPADWSKYGKRAGYIRNQQMLDEGQPDIVIAFPGGRGTAMMVKIAKEAGVPVHEI